MNLLVLDTSTKSTVIGLKTAEQVIDRTAGAGASHSREILPAIQSIMDEARLGLADLDAIAFGQGPGSFTGLRIAVGVVQGLAYGLNIPVVPVSSMAALAQALVDDDVVARGYPLNILVALTARLEEIYYGAYRLEDGIMAAVGDEGVEDVSSLPLLPAAQWVGVGNAWLLKDKIEDSTGAQFLKVYEETIPSVEGLLALASRYIAAGKTISALEATPVYLREVVAQKNP